MFEKNYYCLVAGLREYALDSDTKGFDAREIIAEILEEVSSGDAEAVRLLYGYYDCENIIALRAGRSAYNPLGNIPAEELEQEMASPKALPKAMAQVLKDYAATESEETEGVDLSLGFERALLTAYYEECARSKSRFVRQWAEFDRTLRNVTAAAVARSIYLGLKASYVSNNCHMLKYLLLSPLLFKFLGRLPVFFHLLQRHIVE